MSKGATKSFGKTDLEILESIRTQADTLLCLLDESGLSEAAALMARTVDAINAHVRRLPPNDHSKMKRED